MHKQIVQERNPFSNYTEYRGLVFVSGQIGNADAGFNSRNVFDNLIYPTNIRDCSCIGSFGYVFSGFTFYTTSCIDCMLSLVYNFVNCSSGYVHFVLYNMSFIAGISCSGL
jgi:hypothetical protein